MVYRPSSSWLTVSGCCHVNKSAFLNIKLHSDASAIDTCARDCNTYLMNYQHSPYAPYSKVSFLYMILRNA